MRSAAPTGAGSTTPTAPVEVRLVSAIGAGYTW